MAFEYFYEKDPEFKHWMDEHHDGYVLNCYNGGKLHTADCKSYRRHGEKMTHSRAKACSTSERELLKYAKDKGWDVPVRCQQCS